MGFQRIVYNAIFKRTSTFVITMVGGGLIFERSFDVIANNIFDNLNKGRQWKDIKHKYETKAE